MSLLGARAARAESASGFSSWTVVDASGLPVLSVEQYLSWLRALARSVNTVRTYALLLSQYMRWLGSKQLDWENVRVEDLSTFLLVFRRGAYPLEVRGGGGRADVTVKTMAAAVKEFYDFHRHEGRGPRDLVLTRLTDRSRTPRTRFMENVSVRAEGTGNRLVATRSASRSVPQTITFDQFDKVIESCHSPRDRLVVATLYYGGLRVGQALGLRHGDLDLPARTVEVVRRTSNANGALSKSRDPVQVRMPRVFFDHYRDYLLDQLVPKKLESDYLFVNVEREPIGAPCSYSNIYDQVRLIGLRAGLRRLTPHVLRHSHATDLARSGRTSAEIAKRLGHRHSASADVYIHLASDDIGARFEQTAPALWPREVVDGD